MNSTEPLYPRIQLSSYPLLFRLLEVAHEMLSIPYEDRFIFYNDKRLEYKNSDCLQKQDASSPEFHRFAVEAGESEDRIVVNLIAFFNTGNKAKYYAVERDINIVLLQEKFRCSNEVEYKAYTEGQEMLKEYIYSIFCKIKKATPSLPTERKLDFLIK